MFRYEGRHLKRLARTGHLEPPGERPLLSELYHENSKLTPLTARVAYAEQSRFDRAARLVRPVRVPRKVHSLGDVQPLEGAEAPSDELERTIAARRSARSFAGGAVTRGELGRLLRYSYGVSASHPDRRPVASAGALYPLELYAVAWNIEGLEPAVYHYDAQPHRLDVVARGDFSQALSRSLHLEGLDAGGAAALLAITAVFARSALKYRERAYRFTLLEAGEVAQNIALLATYAGLASCAVSGFLDDELSALLGADGYSESVLLPLLVGRRVPGGASHTASSASAAGVLKERTT